DKKQPGLEELPPGVQPSLEPIMKTAGGDPDPLPPLSIGEDDKTTPTVSDPVAVKRPGDRDPPKKKADKGDDPIDLPPLPTDLPKTDRETSEPDTLPDALAPSARGSNDNPKKKKDKAA